MGSILLIATDTTNNLPVLDETLANKYAEWLMFTLNTEFYTEVAKLSIITIANAFYLGIVVVICGFWGAVYYFLK